MFFWQYSTGQNQTKAAIVSLIIGNKTPTSHLITLLSGIQHLQERSNFLK